MVDDTGIEPVTPSMSTKCSPAELIVRVNFVEFVLPAPLCFGNRIFRFHNVQKAWINFANMIL